MIQRKLLTLNLILVSTIFLCSTVFGQTRQQTDLVEISNNGANVSWLVKVPYESAAITITLPNGEVFRRVFKAGAVMSFTPSTEFGSGRYNYEIVLTPTLPPDVKQALARSRIDGNSDAVRDDFIKRGIIPSQPMLASGTFAYENGNLMTAGDPEKEIETPGKTGDARVETKVEPRNPTTKAGDTDVPTENVQVINDDLVVLGSECIGLDCPTSPSFGFDTLRLQENNLRINFADTSNTASFPTNDWRIVANDTSNGGASYLAIEDTDAGNQPFRVEAGAGSAALWVTDSGGNVGMGTTNPVVELHIADGDTPTVRLEQNGASGFTPQTWDVAGNEANFFVRDVTNGSQLPFQIKPGADTASLFIAANNNVGVGTDTPSQRLDVRGSVQAGNNGSFIVESGSTGGIFFADGTFQSTAGGGGGGGGEVNTAANVGAGTGVFKQKVGAQLQFKSLVAGANVTIAPSGADSIQISASVPSSGSILAQHIFGGEGKISPGGTIANPTVNYNKFGIGTGGQVGFFAYQYSVPYNLNLSDQTAAQVTYRIRYRDTDGVANASRVLIEVVGIDINTGGEARDTIFDSNTNGGVGFQTVDVCRAVNTNYFNAAVRGMHINVTLIGTAAQTADFQQMQIYKGPTCP